MFFKEDRFFSEKPLVASVGRECVLGVLGALGGKTIQEEGVCCFSCGWVGWMGAKETKAKGCCAERDLRCRHVCLGVGQHVFGVCSIRKRLQVQRVQRKHKGFLRVEHSTKVQGGGVGGIIIREREGRCLGSGVVSWPLCCLLSCFHLVFYPCFRRPRRQNEGVVRVENLGKVSHMVLTCVPCTVCGVIARVSSVLLLLQHV